MKKKRRTIELAQQTAEMFARCVAVLKPPPELTLFPDQAEPPLHGA